MICSCFRKNMKYLQKQLLLEETRIRSENFWCVFFCVIGNSLESPITQKVLTCQGTFFFIVDSDLRLMSNLFKFHVFPPIFGDQNRRFAPSVWQILRNFFLIISRVGQKGGKRQWPIVCMRMSSCCKIWQRISCFCRWWRIACVCRNADMGGWQGVFWEPCMH